jgi:formate/nitrite transporter FocA (FNT family)
VSPAALVAANPGLAKLLFALVFPVGLTMNTLHGTELFTGNTMKLPAAIYEGKTNMGGLIKNWFWSYSGALGSCSSGFFSFA